MKKKRKKGSGVQEHLTKVKLTQYAKTSDRWPLQVDGDEGVVVEEEDEFNSL